jgi:hypothetical protein
MEDRALNLLLWDGLLPVIYLGRPMDVALHLSSECFPSTTSYPFPALEETLDTFLLTDSSKRKPDVCTCSIGDRRLAWP